MEKQSLTENEKPYLKWWEDKVDEMFVSFIIGAISIFAIYKGGTAGITVAATAIGGLCVYVTGKVSKK